MVCEKLTTLKQLVVENPLVLEGEEWLRHFKECTDCREEKAGLENSLTVFKQLEGERLSGCTLGPTWERLCAALIENQPPRNPSKFPILAAAVIGAFIIGAIGSWALFDPNQIDKNHIVKEKGPVSIEPNHRVEQVSKTSTNVDGNNFNRKNNNDVWGELRLNQRGQLEVVRYKQEGDALAEKTVYSLNQNSPYQRVTSQGTPSATPVLNQKTR